MACFFCKLEAAMDTIAAIDVFFAGKKQEWMLFKAFTHALVERWPDTQIRVLKTSISFDDPKPYCYVSHPPRKSLGGIFVSISLRERLEHSRFFMVVPVSKTRFTAHISVTDEAQIDGELLDLIALSRR